MHFCKTETQRLPSMHFFRAESLPHKFITSVPVLFSPLPFFYLVRDVRRLSFSFLRLIPYWSIPHITTWKLVSCYQVKYYILCQSLLLISSWPGCSFILSHFEHTSVSLLYFNCLHISQGRNWKLLETRKHYFHVYILPFRTVPNTQYLFTDF